MADEDGRLNDASNSQETNKCCFHISKLLEQFPSETSGDTTPKPKEDGADGPVVFFRPASLNVPSKFSACEAEGEAVALLQEFLLQRDMPLWLATFLSYDFVKTAPASLVPRETCDSPHRPIDGTVFLKAVINSFVDYCRQLIDNIALTSTITEPVDAVQWSACAIRNQRRKMEDRHVVLPLFDHLPLRCDSVAIAPEQTTSSRRHFFAVYDGHGGAECANYAAAHLHRSIILDDADSDPDVVLTTAFRRTEERLLRKCTEQRLKSGATAVCCYIKEDELAVGWLGDCQAALVSVDTVRRLVTTHNPDNQNEYERIEKAGGVVMCVQGELRVNGVLNVSRALGDVAARPAVSGEAEVEKISLTAQHQLLILGCDGVFDSIEDGELLTACKEYIGTTTDADYNGLASAIVRTVKEEKSASDNLTAVVVYLKPVSLVWGAFRA